MKEQDGIFEKYRGHTEPGGTKGSTLIQVKFLSADDSGGLASVKVGRRQIHKKRLSKKDKTFLESLFIISTLSFSSHPSNNHLSELYSRKMITLRSQGDFYQTISHHTKLFHALGVFVFLTYSQVSLCSHNFRKKSLL